MKHLEKYLVEVKELKELQVKKEEELKELFDKMGKIKEKYTGTYTKVEIVKLLKQDKDFMVIDDAIYNTEKELQDIGDKIARAARDLDYYRIEIMIEDLNVVDKDEMNW